MTSRILRYISFKTLAIFQFLYLIFYALPKLYFHELISFPLSISRGYSSFLLATRDYFIKLAVSSNATIKKEYQKFCRIRNDYFLLKDILPNYIIVKFTFISALRSEFLNKISHIDSLKPAIEIQKKFDSTIIPDKVLHLNNCPEIIMGISYFEKNFGKETSNKLKKIVNNFLSSGKYHVGIIHGDFHSRNIMMSASGLVKITDLDCVRFKSIREFDALYFAVEQEWSINKKLWCYSLIDCFSGKSQQIRDYLNFFKIEWSNNLGIMFFLDRIGQDLINYKIIYPKSILERFISTIER